MATGTVNPAGAHRPGTGEHRQLRITHYTFALAPRGILLSPQDAQDIIAWLKLL